jgi:type IV pilus assembly protein PilN
MIRINLLAAERPAAKKKAAAAAPGALQAYLFLALFGGGALFVCGAAYWFKAAQIADLDSKIAQNEKRQQELQAIKKQVDAFEARKKTLEAKIKLIEELKARQGGPVHMLDEISKALPDFVWLTAMDQTGDNVKFDGEGNSLTSVADFISGLERTGWFPKVELVDSVEQQNIVKFKLSAIFKSPEIAAKEKAAAEAAKAAASVAAKK